MKPEEYPTSHAIARQLLSMPDQTAVMPFPVFDMLFALYDQLKAQIATAEALLKRPDVTVGGLPHIWWHPNQQNWWLSTSTGSKAIGTFVEALAAYDASQPPCGRCGAPLANLREFVAHKCQAKK